MDIQLQSIETTEDIIESDSVSEPDPPLNSEEVKKLSREILNSDKYKTELQKPANDGDHQQLSKNLNVREIHETSPLKKAVKGFVLSKLSKKVGTSHILSGLTEKIVKKLEDNKDTSPSVSVHNSESDLSISSLRVTEASTEVISSSVSCELKSVVANDLALSEALNIEDAVECTEEPKSSIKNIDILLGLPQRNELRSNSISLPSSPAHQLTKRSSSISCSLEDAESHEKYSLSPNLTFLSDEQSNNYDCKSESLISLNEIELKDLSQISGQEIPTNSEFIYPKNIYHSDRQEIPNFKRVMWNHITSSFSALADTMSFLTMTHLFLLASVVIHNLCIVPSFVAFIFDSLIMAYLCYSYICALLQKPIPNMTLNFPFLDPHLEHASIQIQKPNKQVKGSVKVLKGEYDREMVKYHPTDLVDISIENSCLKIYTPKKKKDSPVQLNSFMFYDLLGASVSLVPKDVSRRSIWNKKYPICITFPVVSKKASTPVDNSDVDSPTSDYLSTIHDENSDVQKKALYLFSLTDREKETLFWTILRNMEDDDVQSKEQTSGTSQKIDSKSLTYAALLELNGEDEDDSFMSRDIDDDSFRIEKANKDLEFETYMKNLFENYERMVKFCQRSRSLEDLSSLKDDVSKLSESSTSKDDSFLLFSEKRYSVDWLNLALGRTFYDFLTQKCWSDDVKARIQKKLDKIEMPSFIASLEVSDVFLGTSLPQIHTVSNPSADDKGIWFDFDFTYCGTFQMTLKTKLMMTKAKQLREVDSGEVLDSKQGTSSFPSSDSEEEEDNEPKNTPTRKKKLINRIEKWISHKHFQTVAQSRFVKRYVGDLSNMPLALTVELNTLHGTLTINIPPAPTDRIWYGFRKDPVLSLNAYPKVGTREINLSSVVKLIERKLIQEFKKALVMPNMDDLLIPVMHSPVYEL